VGGTPVQLLAGGEVIRLTSHPVELASGSHRVDGVAVGCVSLDVFHIAPGILYTDGSDLA
jgi:hypothetical protein